MTYDIMQQMSEMYSVAKESAYFVPTISAVTAGLVGNYIGRKSGRNADLTSQLKLKEIDLAIAENESDTAIRLSDNEVGAEQINATNAGKLEQLTAKLAHNKVLIEKIPELMEYAKAWDKEYMQPYFECVDGMKAKRGQYIRDELDRYVENDSSYHSLADFAFNEEDAFDDLLVQLRETAKAIFPLPDEPKRPAVFEDIAELLEN